MEVAMSANLPGQLISIVTPTFNEEENVAELYHRICTVLNKFPNYLYEIIVIDNASTDSTVERLKAIAAADNRFKIIVNTRNFGHIRSPYWGLMQAKGDAVVYLASDLQDPPELIEQFIRKWESGSKVVFAVKPRVEKNNFFNTLRKVYYRLLDRISEVQIVKDATGFGLYDKIVLNQIRSVNDPYPYFRGLICELGYDIALIPFEQPRRQRGISKNNFYTLYDIAMLGIVSHSLVPIRLASLLGFIMGTGSILMAFVFLLLKLLWWNHFPLGVAPIVIGMFFMFGVILLFIGLLGEYIGSIHTYVRKRPVVVERERINF